MRVVIVGGSFGGVQAAVEIKREAPETEVLVIEKQTELGFVPGSLALILQGKAASVAELRWITRAELEAQGIHVRTGVSCTGLLPDHQIQLSTGEAIGFDRLVIATGSRQSFQQEEMSSARIKTCKTEQDVTDILTQLEELETVAIVGGGHVGLELADAFAQTDKQIHLFESDTMLMGHYFDEEMILPLETAIRQSAVHLHMGTFVESMEETNEGHVRLFFEETNLAVDLVVLANSTRPDNHIWQALDRNDDGTLKVNAYLQTSDPNIYAIGDTIKVRFQLTGEELYVSLVTNALRTASIASQNILGTPEEDPGTVRVSGNQWFGYFVGSAGLLEKEALLYPEEIQIAQVDVPVAAVSKEKMKLKVIWDAETEVLLGVQLVSKWMDFALLDLFALAIQQQQTIHGFQVKERFFHPAFRAPLLGFSGLGEK
ncbi:FAD-dependent oxidoreductase [Enterococcus gilvus]|uniref:FAD-dependent oxidoreductase n=1 Tax=Enterococcus gilvus TaxID=160453 RepID=UPI00345E72CE